MQPLLWRLAGVHETSNVDEAVGRMRLTYLGMLVGGLAAAFFAVGTWALGRLFENDRSISWGSGIAWAVLFSAIMLLISERAMRRSFGK